ncbi:MAG: pilus assembly protein, partial [Rhodocyclaceae bacterium]
LIALDVTNPGAFGSQPTHFKWSYPNGTDADLGLMLDAPQITKMNNGDVAVIVGNGYNSTNGRAVLYILKLSDGSVLKKIDTGVGSDNGLAAPGLVDDDGDGDVDVIYAGDLKGNVWKFDVSSSNPSQWKSAFLSGTTPLPLFTAKAPNGTAQPITAPITSARNLMPGDPNFGKRYVFFGTGSYVFSNDPANPQTQSWYGLIDDDQRITGRSELKVRSITEEGTFAGFSIRKFSQATANDMAGKKGWVLDFTTQSGERIVTASRLHVFASEAPVLIASSIIPRFDPCSPGGDGYINAINPFTGGRVSAGIFDLNANGNFTEEAGIGGFKPNVGMPTEPVFVGNRLVVGGSAGTVASVIANRQPAGRISWREIMRD